jgi:hypothetical protein
VALAGDSLVIASWPARITVLGPDLSLVSTFSLEDYAFRVHWLSGTTFLAELVYPSVVEYQGEGGLIRHPLSVARFDRQGRLLDTLLVTAGYEELMQRREGGISAVRTLFGKQATVGVGHALLVTGSAESMELPVHDDEGALRRILRVPGYPLGLTPDEVAAEQAAWVGPDPSPRARALVGSLPVPSSRPAYTELLVDSEGCIWAGSFQGLANLEDPRAWEVFSAEGQWLGTRRTPTRFAPFQIGPDHVLGRALDHWDAETVQVLRLRR